MLLKSTATHSQNLAENLNQSGFHYAYVINSAWLPEYQISDGTNTFVTSRAPTYLLGTYGKHNEHMDWLRAAKYTVNPTSRALALSVLVWKL